MDVDAAIGDFLRKSRQPVLMEPGEDPLPITPETFALRPGVMVTVECWSETRNLVRRVRGVLRQKRGSVELEVERFGGRAGTLLLVDLADPANYDARRRGSRLKYRERFRLSLRRQFPGWRIAELSTEPDLHHTLSPSYPRALLRKGGSAMAAIGAAQDSLSPESVLSFGLIWLDYVRHRETRIGIEGLAVFVPAGAEITTCHRVRYLNSQAARYLVFVHHAGQEDAIEPGDYTNFETHLDPCRRAMGESPPRVLEWVDQISNIEGVERRDRSDGSVSLAVNGLEFARAAGAELLFGIDHKHPARSAAHLGEIEQLARGLTRMRTSRAPDRSNPIYTRHPEAWLESKVRASVETLDATLYPNPVYGQVPQFAAGERGVIDLLAAGREGRLSVIELKAVQDIHLPLQALDYWMRVKWHLDRGEFAAQGYFPGIGLSQVAPRLLLVAPALDFHPSNETVLRYFSPAVPVERIGIGIEWRRNLRIMFRVPSGSARL